MKKQYETADNIDGLEIVNNFSVQIENPDWIEMTVNGKTIYGLNQIWYDKRFKKTAGCGPTAATTLLLYQNKRISGPFVYKNDTIENVAIAMNEVWKFVTPGLMGLNTSNKFVKGMNNLFKHYDLDWSCHELPISRNSSTEKAAQFIKSGLSLNSPVAFLNLHTGIVKDFEGWHWIVITGLSFFDNKYIATGYDLGNKITFNLHDWISTTKIGGGFVYIS